MKKHVLSILLVIALVIGMMPITAYAEDTDLVCAGSSQSYGSFIDGYQVLEDLLEVSGMNQHPRIIMSKDKFDELKTHIGENSATGTVLEHLKLEADGVLKKDLETYVTNDDHLLETSKRIQRRVAALAMAYNIYGDRKYADRAYKELEAACGFPDWSPVHFLDTAEMCTAFAFGYDWLYDYLDDDQKAFLRENMIEKGLNQVMQDYTDTPSDRERTYKWYQDEKGDNWQLVCTGGTNLVALAIGDEEGAEDICAQVLTYGYKRAYDFVRRAYNTKDGTYIEGLGYWDYATYYLGLQSSALISATGTDYGLTDYEGIVKSAEFVRYMSSNVPLSFSFGDDRESRNTGWPVFLWLGENLNSPELAAVRIRKINIPRYSFDYLDVLWIDESKQTCVETDNDTDWGGVGASNASFRTTWDQSGLVAALHTGENYYKYHGHFDLGSFYIEYNGARFFTDLGNESYKLEDRKVSYRIKPEGHNTLVLNPSKGTDQRDEITCLITDYASGNEAYAVTDLTEAYADNNAKSVVRGLKMIKDKECVIIQDEIELESAGEIYWFAHTSGQIEVAADGRSAIVASGSERLWVGLMSEGGEFSYMEAVPLSESLVVSGATDNKDYRKLAIHLSNTKKTTISVACIPLKNGETSPSWTPSVKAIADWSTAVEVKGCTLSLSDNIGLNVYAMLSDCIANANGAEMIFSVDGKEISVPVAEAKKEIINGENLYKFTCSVSAAYMTSNITAQVRVLSDGKLTGVGDPYICSVRSYADAIIKSPDKYGANNVAVVKAMLNYGAYAQQYFGVNTSNLANKNIYTSANDPVLNFSQNLSSQQLTSVTTKGDLVFYGVSLVCNGETSLKLYFGSKSEATISSSRYTVKATTGGNTVNCSGVISNNMYVVTISNITASELDNVYQFTVIDTKSSSNKFTFDYSPVNYIANAQTSTNESLVNLTKAMYLYNQAANKK